MSTTHSPSPWKLDGASQITAANGVAVATVWSHNDRDLDFHPPQDLVEVALNAALIAAAPELLAWLKRHHDGMSALSGKLPSVVRGSVRDQLDLLAALIGRAEGRSA